MQQNYRPRVGENDDLVQEKQLYQINGKSIGSVFSGPDTAKKGGGNA